MGDSISVTGTLVALLLPLAMGTVWTYWLLARTGRWHPALVAGHGYLLGVFFITLLIRAWDALGLALSFLGISAIALAITLCGVVLLRMQRLPPRVSPPSAAVPLWQTALTLLLIALVALRYATMLEELLLRPLFPWDAWMNWAPKAVVWYHYGELVPFADIATWLAEPAEARTHIEGAKNAWKYPIGVPLVQLWGMLGAGTSDHTVIYLPWLFIGLATGAALYGHLRLNGAPTVLSVTAVYALLNMPFVNVHSVLAGYADLWIAAAFGCAVFALHEWSRDRQWQYGLIAVLLAIFCAQLKTPGIIMGAIVLVTLVLVRLNLQRRAWLALAAAATAVSLFFVFVGIDLHIPAVGKLTINDARITVPYIGNFQIAFHNVSAAIATVLFDMINWNLLWYLLVPLALLLAARPQLRRGLNTGITALSITLVFLFFVYFFTERYQFAEDYTQVNRALIYTVPVSILLIFSVLQRLLEAGYSHVAGFSSDRSRTD